MTGVVGVREGVSWEEIESYDFGFFIVGCRRLLGNGRFEPLSGSLLDRV